MCLEKRRFNKVQKTINQTVDCLQVFLAQDLKSD